MRLSDLSPRWFGFSHPANGAEDIKLGMTFECRCPACQASGKPIRLAVSFSNPIDPLGKLHDTTWNPPPMSWRRSGEQWDRLTIEPSFDASARGHWHVVIASGEVIAS